MGDRYYIQQKANMDVRHLLETHDAKLQTKTRDKSGVMGHRTDTGRDTFRRWYDSIVHDD